MRRCSSSVQVLLAFAFFILMPADGRAITITAPQTVEAGRAATIVITGIPTRAVDARCFLNIDYGDGSEPSTSLAQCTDAGVPCTATVTHTYRNPGSYVLRAYSSGCIPGILQGDPATRAITVIDLKIQRLDIYLPNRLPKMSVKQYQRDLKAFVDIRYTGAGLLQGQWEIDGRLLSKVNKQLYQGGQKITIQTPLAPALPTHAVGTHRLRFVVTRPELGFDFPQAVYFVETDAGPFDLAIRLTGPPDNMTTVCAPIALRWHTAGKAYVYLVEMIAGEDKDPTLSAYAKETSYTLREDLCRSLLSSGRSYRWRVKGLSQEGQIIGESDEFNLYLTSE
jgi:hypothetical protein